MLALLKDYSCLQPRIPQNEAESQALRKAIAWLCEQSDGENFGICADSQSEAENALRAYLDALGYASATIMASKEASDGVYLKCNTQSLRYYVEPYEGEYRGVLIACQSENNEAISGTYGYFPLGLFA